MISLPSHPEPGAYWHIAANLVFDPLKSLHYKVIFVRLSILRNVLELDQPKVIVMSIGIYSSETKSWSLSQFNFTWDGRFVDYDLGVFIKGAIHWPSVDKATQYFEVENECLKQMPMPNIKTESVACRYFGDCGGYLNFAAAYWSQYPKFKCNVFEMLEDRSDWYLKYTFCDEIPFEVSLGMGTFKNVMLFSIQSKEEGDSLFVELGNGKGISYNFKDGKRIIHSPIINQIRMWLFHRTYQHIETRYCV